jgi:hypothetical protein
VEHDAYKGFGHFKYTGRLGGSTHEWEIFRVSSFDCFNMAKADILRNYYSDLEISPQADTDEIKKQYRKLGWFLPDRIGLL